MIFAVRWTFLVEGMTCDHCVRAVREEVGAVPGVEVVDVELTTGEVIVQSGQPFDEALVAAAVEEAGYRLVER